MGSPRRARRKGVVPESGAATCVGLCVVGNVILDAVRSSGKIPERALELVEIFVTDLEGYFEAGWQGEEYHWSIDCQKQTGLSFRCNHRDYYCIERFATFAAALWEWVRKLVGLPAAIKCEFGAKKPAAVILIEPVVRKGATRPGGSKLLLWEYEANKFTPTTTTIDTPGSVAPFLATARVASKAAVASNGAVWVFDPREACHNGERWWEDCKYSGPSDRVLGLALSARGHILLYAEEKAPASVKVTWLWVDGPRDRWREMDSSEFQHQRDGRILVALSPLGVRGAVVTSTQVTFIENGGPPPKIRDICDTGAARKRGSTLLDAFFSEDGAVLHIVRKAEESEGSRVTKTRIWAAADNDTFDEVRASSDCAASENDAARAYAHRRGVRVETKGKAMKAFNWSSSVDDVVTVGLLSGEPDTSKFELCKDEGNWRWKLDVMGVHMSWSTEKMLTMKADLGTVLNAASQLPKVPPFVKKAAKEEAFRGLSAFATLPFSEENSSKAQVQLACLRCTDEYFILEGCSKSLAAAYADVFPTLSGWKHAPPPQDVEKEGLNSLEKFLCDEYPRPPPDEAVRGLYSDAARALKHAGGDVGCFLVRGGDEVPRESSKEVDRLTRRELQQGKHSVGRSVVRQSRRTCDVPDDSSTDSDDIGSISHADAFGIRLETQEGFGWLKRMWEDEEGADRNEMDSVIGEHPQEKASFQAALHVAKWDSPDGKDCKSVFAKVGPLGFACNETRIGGSWSGTGKGTKQHLEVLGVPGEIAGYFQGWDLRLSGRRNREEGSKPLDASNAFSVAAHIGKEEEGLRFEAKYTTEATPRDVDDFKHAFQLSEPSVAGEMFVKESTFKTFGFDSDWAPQKSIGDLKASIRDWEDQREDQREEMKADEGDKKDKKKRNGKNKKDTKAEVQADEGDKKKKNKRDKKDKKDKKNKAKNAENEADESPRGDYRNWGDPVPGCLPNFAAK